MTGLKNTLITAIIGGILTIMAQGLSIGQAAPMPVAYKAPPAPLSTADWLWWQVVWWLPPVAVIMLVGATAIRAAAKRQVRESPGTKERREFDQWRLDKMFGNHQPKQLAPPVEVEKPSVSWLSMADAFNQSSERKWIIGQATEQQPNRESSKQAAGQLLTVDYQTANFAILGGIGGGKTSSTGMMMLMYAKKYRLHTIVLDGKDGLDWGPLGDSGVIEWHTMTPDNLGGYIEQLNRIYKERHALMRQHRVGKIYDLPKSLRPQPLFVIMEEFGRTWARADKNKDIENGFNDLFCLSRAAGIVLCPIDQAPEDWSRAMRANAKIAICYPAQGDALKAFGEHYVAELPQTGHFSRGNVFYKAWHTTKQYDMHRLPPIQRRYLTTPNVSVQSDERHERSERTPTNAGSLDTFAPEANYERTNERYVTTPMALPPSMIRSFVRSNDWDKAAQHYFSLYPSAEHIDWCKAMAQLAGDGREYTAFKGGLSQRLYHSYSPNGKKYMRLAS